MITFEIRDEAYAENRLLGYLFYFERSKRFFAELLSSVDEWTAPFIFSGFVKEKVFSIGSAWSMKFVSQRIIPPDRQNLGGILKANNLKEYDEYKLLLLSEGRCAQDELSVKKISDSELSSEITKRLQRKVKDVLPLEKNKLVVFFRDGTQVVTEVKNIRKDDISFNRVLSDPEMFDSVKVTPGGNGVEWGSERTIPAEELYSEQEIKGLNYFEMLAFMAKRTVDTTEAANIMNCSRQYISQLVAQKKIVPVHSESNNNLFLRSDLESEVIF